MPNPCACPVKVIHPCFLSCSSPVSKLIQLIPFNLWLQYISNFEPLLWGRSQTEISYAWHHSWTIPYEVFLNIFPDSKPRKSSPVTHVSDNANDGHGSFDTLLPSRSGSGRRVDRGLLRGLRQRGRHGLKYHQLLFLSGVQIKKLERFPSLFTILMILQIRAKVRSSG